MRPGVLDTILLHLNLEDALVKFSEEALDLVQSWVSSKPTSEDVVAFKCFLEFVD